MHLLDQRWIGVPFSYMEAMCTFAWGRSEF